MNITFYGHSTFFIEWNGKKMIIDPFISGNAKASSIDINSIEVDYILVSHGHQDHILDVEAIAKNNPDAILISNYEIVSHFGKKGIKGHPLNHGGKVNVDFGTIKYVNAIHTSSFPDGSYAGNPGGFVIWDDNSCIYFAGDTAVTMDMKLIPLSCPPLDLAILPIGDNFTMGLDDAIIASDLVNCEKVIGCHFDTFPPIEINHEEAKQKFQSQSKELTLLNVGDSINF